MAIFYNFYIFLRDTLRSITIGILTTWTGLKIGYPKPQVNKAIFMGKNDHQPGGSTGKASGNVTHFEAKVMAWYETKG